MSIYIKCSSNTSYFAVTLSLKCHAIITAVVVDNLDNFK